MRIAIMTDLEGVCGVQDIENWCRKDSRHAELAKELLTREVNAAVEGFLAAGASSILVSDIHGGGRGINPSLLHPAAELSCHRPHGRNYPHGLDSGPFDAAAWVGFHPKAGTPGGHLCHTVSHSTRDMSINGISVGEFGQLVLCAGELGIRAIFASGCKAFTEEAQALVPGIETVAVKRGTQTDPGHALPAEAYMTHDIAAVHLSPEEARTRIRAGARRALKRARKETFGLVRLAPPYHSVTVFRSTEQLPPRIVRKSHHASVIALLNGPGTGEGIDADPLTLLPRP